MTRWSISVLLSAVILVLLSFSATASASWGPEPPHCSAGEGHHCYALAERDIYRFGGVLASIDFVDTTGANITSPAFVSNEEWISFEDQGPQYAGWIETGQSVGDYTCCEEHPFFAEKQKGVYKEELSPGTVPLNSYNHYVLFDSEKNGRWHIYWGCCEVGSYGGGWPVYLTDQEAGIEAATELRPSEYGRQQVAASDGGEWTPWSGDSWTRYAGLCMSSNPESSAAGNIEWKTVGPPANPECK